MITGIPPYMKGKIYFANSNLKGNSFLNLLDDDDRVLESTCAKGENWLQALLPLHKKYLSRHKPQIHGNTRNASSQTNPPPHEYPHGQSLVETSDHILTTPTTPSSLYPKSWFSSSNVSVPTTDCARAPCKKLLEERKKSTTIEVK